MVVVAMYHQNNMDSLSETITHLLQFCPRLRGNRESLAIFTSKYSLNLPYILKDLISSLCLPESPMICQFLLDCSTLPAVISASQSLVEVNVHDHLFYISKIWVYAIHRESLKKLGMWKKYTI